MKLYFAGAENKKYAEILMSCGVPILESAFYLRYKHEPNRYKAKEYLLDSGGFTALMQNFKLDLKTYIDYLNKHKVKIAFALDVRDQETTIKNTYDLKKYTDTKIIPVYHDHDYFSSKRNLIEKYCADFDYVSIAGLTRKNFPEPERIKFGNYMFSVTRDKIKVHGLAVTTEKWLYKYPFYSVDSTTYLSVVKFASSREFKDKTKMFDYIVKEKRLGSTLLRQEIKNFVRLEEQITAYWRQRGVTWNEI